MAWIIDVSVPVGKNYDAKQIVNNIKEKLKEIGGKEDGHASDKKYVDLQMRFAQDKEHTITHFIKSKMKEHNIPVDDNNGAMIDYYEE